MQFDKEKIRATAEKYNFGIFEMACLVHIKVDYIVNMLRVEMGISDANLEWRFTQEVLEDPFKDNFDFRKAFGFENELLYYPKPILDLIEEYRNKSSKEWMTEDEYKLRPKSIGYGNSNIEILQEPVVVESEA